jgi:hypothetical protein
MSHVLRISVLTIRATALIALALMLPGLASAAPSRGLSVEFKASEARNALADGKQGFVPDRLLSSERPAASSSSGDTQVAVVLEQRDVRVHADLSHLDQRVGKVPRPLTD